MRFGTTTANTEHYEEGSGYIPDPFLYLICSLYSIFNYVVIIRTIMRNLIALLFFVGAVSCLAIAIIDANCTAFFAFTTLLLLTFNTHKK